MTADLSELLGVKEWKQEEGEDKPEGELSFFVRDDDEGGSTFFVHRDHIAREELISKVRDYLTGVEIPDDVICGISPVMAVYSTISVASVEKEIE